MANKTMDEAIKNHICVICSGNICRSPMGEALLLHELEAAGMTGYTVSSAGTYAMIGTGASPHAQTAMEELGLDIRKHRARQLDKGICEDVGLILCMTPGHVQEAVRICPGAKAFTHTILGYAEGVLGFPKQRSAVEDPYGMSLDVYKDCRDKIRHAITLCLPYLAKGVGFRRRAPP